MAVLQMNMTDFVVHWQQGGFILDVREPEEHLCGVVPGAFLLPLGRVVTHAHTLPKSKRVAVICRSGHRSDQAAAYLCHLGFDAVNVQGGMLAWNGPLSFPELPRDMSGT